MTLAEAGLNKKVKVVLVKNTTGGGIRLSELGIVPGTMLQIVNKVTNHGPYLVDLGNYWLALRGEEAAEIEVSTL